MLKQSTYKNASNKELMEIQHMYICKNHRLLDNADALEVNSVKLHLTALN